MFQKKIRSWFSSFLRQDQHNLKKPRKKPKLLPIGLNVENLEARLTPDSRLFNYTGSLESWIVPTDVTSVQISIYGASGGAGGYDGGTSGGAAGNVGYVSGTMNVNPGDILKFYIGASGQNGLSSVSGYGGGTGGTNSFTTFSVAGGTGGNAGNAGSSGGGGGGGSASVVEYISQGVTKYIVAGGGGGGGGAANGPVGTQGITGNISSTFTSGRAGQNTPFNYDGGGGGGGGGGYNGVTGGGGIGGSTLLNGEYVGQGGNAGANFTSSIVGLSTSYSSNNQGHGFATISYSFNSPNFKPQTTFATWNKAGKVITTDVNNDGKQDIVVQNIGYALPNSGPRYDYVSLFLGKGDGGFNSRIDTPTGSYSNWLGSGDFNGDGKVDFVTPNYCGESITILLGRGDGTFSRNDISNAGGTISPSFVTTGDVDGDGKIDILTTNQNSSNLSVFLGRGDGTFQAPNVIPTSAIPNRIVLGDFNSDGKTDLVVHTNPGSGPTNTLFLGTGAGGFASNSTIGITGELTVGDFNRDGSLDLAGTETNTVKVLLGNGNATFKTAQSFAATGVGASIIATDINGDGALDLQLTQFNNNTVAVMVGSGDGTFKSPLTFGTGTNPFTVASADFNNDGKRDLVVSNLNSNNLSVLLHLDNTAPTLTTISTLSGASEDLPYTITYDSLLAAANEYDAEGNSISFRIESVLNGTLTKNGIAVLAGATLLGPGESLVWTPSLNANGTLGAFTVKAFDGGLASSTAIQVAVNVAAVNDAPVASSATATLAAINEDALNPSGSTIQNLFGGLFSDSADNQRQAPVTETFSNSTDGWVNGILDSTSSQSWGSFLGRFGMNAEISKTFAIGGAATTISFEFMRIDSWDGELFRLFANDNLIINQPFTGGQITNTLSGSASGFTWTMTPTDYGYKSNAGWDDQKFVVTLNVPSGINNLTLRMSSTLDQDASDESWGIDNFNLGIGGGDGSIANSFAGVAISNYTVDAAKGSWQYSTNGTNWLNLQSATTITAITLKSADYLRFVPAANYNGLATALTANLIETSGSAITSGATVNVSGAGGATVYSSAAVSLTNTITPVNDAPTLAAIAVSGTEDNTVTFTAANFSGGSIASPGVAYVGLQADMGAGWRTASTAKTYDIDGNNVLGSNGWWLPNYTLSSPSYITSFANNSYYPGNGGYALVDNPLTTPGASPSLIYSGTTNGQFPGYGTKSLNSVVSFTLTGTVPGTIRVGIMTGNTDFSGSYGASGFQIVSGSLNSGMTTELQTNGAVYNGNPDWVFFDITGGIAGQTYSIYANGGPQGNAGIGAISFDSITNTPAYSDVENNPMVSITIATLPATGTLKLLNNNVSAGQVILAADLGNLTYVPAPNENGIKTFTITASDGSASSEVATVSMNITAVNDAPIANADAYTTSEDTPLVTTLLPVVDQQQTTFNTGLPYNGFQTFTAGQTGFLSSIELKQNGGESSNPQQVTLNLYGGAGIGGALLGSVTVSENNSNDFVQTYTFSQPVAIVSGDVYTFKISSSSIRGLLGSSNINSYSNGGYSNSGGLTGDLWFKTLVRPALSLIANDSDAEGDSLTTSVVANPTNGSLAINSNGNFTYTPYSNFNGTDTFTYKTSDGKDFSNVATVTINVTAINDAPVANAQTITPTEDTIYTGNLNGSDVEGSALNYALVAQGTKGVVTITNAATGAFSYVPNANSNGSDSFTFKVNDGSLDSAAVVVTVNITPVNDAPRLTTTTVTLSAVSEDIGNAAPGARVSDLFLYVMDDSTDNGQASLAGVAISSHQPDASKGAWQYSSNGSSWVALPGADLSTAVTLKATDYLRFVPAPNYYGQAIALSANIIETGGAAISSGATVNIAGVGSQIVLASGNVIGWSSIYSGSFAADNVVDEQSGSIVADNFGDNYWLASDGTGSASILIDLGVATPLSKIDLYNTTNTGYNDRGTSNFHIEVANAITGNSATSYALANGVTVASGTMSYENVGVAPAPQSYALSTGGTAYRYVRFVVDTSKYNNPGLHELRLFGVGTGVGGSTVYSQQTVSVNHSITSVNDAPVANAQTINPTEDTTYTGSLTGSDVEGSPLAYSVVAQGAKGVVTITNAATGAFTYVPNINANGVDSFTFKVNDGSLDSAVVTVTVNITPVNDAPVANAQTITPMEDTTYTGNLTGSDVEGSPLTYSVVAQGSKGVATITNAATGAFTYVPNANANGADSFTFKVNDGSLDSAVVTVTVNITPVNDAPVANAQTITPTEDTTYTGSLTGSDLEGGPLTYAVVAQGSKGVVTITNAATGAFTYVPNANANGADSFTFKVNDGSLDSAVVSVTVNITPVNDTPVVSASQPSITLLDYQFTRNWGVDQSFVTITKSDPDGFVQYDDQFFAANGWTSSDNGVTVTKNLTYGYARLRPSTNVLTYYLDQGINLTNRLRQGQTVTETIPVQVTDGQLTALTNVVFTIDGQNDEPELYRVNNLVGATEDSEYEINYSALTNSSQLADIDGGVTAFVVKNVTSGVLKIGANAQSAIPWNASNNSVISTGLNGYWTPALNANGLLAAFTVVVKDDGGLESLNPMQVHVQVAPVNDLPVVGQIAAVTYRNNNGLDVFSNNTGTVSASDVDSGTTLRFGISGQNVNVINGKAVQVGKFGTFVIDLNSGEYTFRPDQILLNALRADDSEIFTITVGDGIATVNTDYRIHFLDLESPEAPAEISFKQDSGFSATDGITSDNILEINGLAESGSQVEIFDGNRSLGIVQAGLNRKWNFTTPLLADGSHELFARAMDASGNRSPNSQVVTVMVDTIAPASPTGITITPDTGSNSKDGIINVGFFSISGVSESGSVIELTGDSILSKGGYSAGNGPWNVGLTKSSQNGAWSYAYDGTHIVGTKIDPTKGTTISLNELRLPTGEYPLEVRAIDAAGNKSSATQFVLKIDRNAPTGSIITLRNGQEIPSGTVQTGTDRQVQVVFDENVLDNLSLENFTTTGSVVLKEIRRIDSKSFLLTMDVVKEGTFTIALSAGSTMDVAGNPNTLISAITLRSDVSWSFETSTAMSSGVPVTGFSDGAKDEDFFKYTATTNGSLLVNATGLNSNFDPFLTAFVRNAEGGYDALISDDNSAGGTAARLRFNTESGKQYFLKVSSLKALPGSFLLTAQEGQRVEDDFGNSRTSANVVTFDGNGSMSQLGSIERSADMDFFKFTTRQAGQVILSVQGSGRESLASGALGIFDASGNPISPTQVDNGFQFPVEAGKTYFFSMESSDGTTGDYLVRGTMEAFLTFTNNSAKAVGALTQGVQDLFKFIAPSTGLYAFHSEDRVSSSIPTFSVLDANRNAISNLSDFGFGPLGTSTGTANANLTVGQTYYLRVGGGNYEGSYEVSARPDDVGSREPSSAHTLNFLGTTGRVDVAGDGDLYRVTYSNTSNTDVVRFRVTQKANLGVQSRLDSQLYVSVDNGTSWVNSTQLNGTLDNRVELAIRPGWTENILVWAAGNGSSTGEYELNYEALTDDLPDQISDIPLNAPTNLSGDLVSGTFGGTINFAGDIDVRKYTAKMDGTFVLDLTTNSTSLDPVLAIYDRNGVLIAKDNDSGAGLNSRLTIETKSGAEYFLRFSDFAGKAQNQAYTLKITQESKQDDHGDNIKFATDLVLNPAGVATSKGEILTREDGNDTDYFRFTATDSAVFNFGVTRDLQSKDLVPTFKVLKDDQSVLFSGALQTNGSSSLGRANLVAGNTYYIQVQGGLDAGQIVSQGGYILAVAKYVPPVTVADDYANTFNTNTTPAVGVLSISQNNGSIVGEITSTKDVDVFRFVPDVSGLVRIDLKSDTGSKLDTILSVLNSNGEQVDTNDNFANTTNSQLILDVNSGTTYYLSASNFNGTLGKYTLGIQSIEAQDSDGAGNNVGAIDAQHTLTLDSLNKAAKFDAINSTGDRDLFKLEVTSAGILNLGLNADGTSKLDGFLRIYKNNLNTLVATDDNSGLGFNSMVAISVTNGDVIYIQTSGVGSSQGNYKVWARLDSDDHGNTISSATLLQNEGNFADTIGEINQIGDSDYFKFVAEYTEVIQVYLYADVGSELNTYLNVYDSNGSLLDYNNDQNGIDFLAATDSAIFLQVEQGQSYYFEVKGASQTIGAFGLLVEPIFDDFGNSMEDAEIVSLVSNTISQAGEIEIAGDQDVFKFVALTSGNYTFAVGGTNSNEDIDTFLQILDENGNVIASNDDAPGSNSTDSFLRFDLLADETYYVRVSSYGDSHGAYQLDITYDPSASADDHGNTTSTATPFVIDGNAATLAGAIGYNGDVDVFSTVVTDNATIRIESSFANASLNGVLKVLINRNDNIIQVGSDEGTSQEVTFQVLGGDEIFVSYKSSSLVSQASGYSIAITQSEAMENTERPVDQKSVDDIAGELITGFNSVASNLNENSDLQQESQRITDLLVQSWFASMDTDGDGQLGQSYLIIWLDPVDFALNTPSGQVGSSGGSSVIENSAASLSSKGALDMVVVSGAQASQYNLQLTGVGSGQVLAGATLITASGQVINPTVSGGSSSSGIASGSVPKSGMQLVLDFTPPSNGGGNNGGGSSNGGNNGGSNGNPGGDSSSVAESSSSSSGSSSGGGRSGGNSSLLNALSRAGDSISSGLAGALEGLAGLALGGGGSATGGADEGALASEFVPGGNGTGNDLLVENKNENAPGSVSAAVKLAQVGVFVITTVSESYSETVDAIQSSITTEQAALKQIASIVDKAIPDVVPSEFEQALEKSLEKTTDLVLKEAKESVAKVGDLLADLVTARINQKPAKANAAAVNPATQIAEANREMVDQEFVAMAQSGLAIDFEFASDPLENHADLITGDQTWDSDFYFETSEWAGLADRKSADEELLRGVGILAGVMLAPGVLSPALDHPIESEKSAKRKKPIRLKD